MQLDADMALLLTEHIQRHGAALPESLRYLELVGPAPTAEIRDAVRRAFGRTAGYLYTSAETGPAALTCPEGRLHVLEDNVVAETVRDGAPALGEAGDVVLTTLGNRAMPLLRYETDDTGVLEPGGDCACGCRGPVLRLEPAGDTRILLPDGRRLHSAELLGAMEYANEYMACAVRQFSIEQTGPAQFHAVLSLKPANQGWGDAVVQAFRAHLRNEALRQADWTFSFVDGPIRQARQGAFVPLGAQAVGIA